MVNFLTNEEVIAFLEDEGLKAHFADKLDPKGCAFDCTGFRYSKGELLVIVSYARCGLSRTTQVRLSDDNITFDSELFKRDYFEKLQKTQQDLYYDWMNYLDQLEPFVEERSGAMLEEYHKAVNGEDDRTL